MLVDLTGKTARFFAEGSTWILLEQWGELLEEERVILKEMDWILEVPDFEVIESKE